MGSTHHGSLNRWLSSFDKKEVRYLERDKAAAQVAMRSVSAKSRRPKHMRNWHFRCARVLGIVLEEPDKPVPLLRVERVK